MKIKCVNCGNTETTDMDFFVKLIGGSMPLGGFWAWTTYFFAGTGFALAIVVAIISGGVAMLVYKDEIVEWIVSQDYKCSACGNGDWIAESESGTSSIQADREITRPSKANLEINNLSFHTAPNRNEAPATISFLRAQGYEVEPEEGGWIILDPQGELHDIKSLEQLKKYWQNIGY